MTIGESKPEVIGLTQGFSSKFPTTNKVLADILIINNNVLKHMIKTLIQIPLPQSLSFCRSDDTE